MTKIHWKAGTLLAPIPPALISCGTIDKPNVMTAAWTGIINSDPPMTYVSIRPSRYSHELITQTREFVINLPNLPLAAITDWCGVKSGKKIDKFKTCGITPALSKHISAPQIQEAPVSIECKVVNIQHFETHDMFLAEIKGVSVDDTYLDKKGALLLEKAGLLAYVHGFYFTLGKKLGKFGFSVEGKRKNPYYKPPLTQTRKRAVSRKKK